VSKEAPVGFQAIRLRFDLDTDATEEQLANLQRLTERYCVVYQTFADATRDRRVAPEDLLTDAALDRASRLRSSASDTLWGGDIMNPSGTGTRSSTRVRRDVPMPEAYTHPRAAPA
jgi:hypothetical protein